MPIFPHKIISISPWSLVLLVALAAGLGIWSVSNLELSLVSTQLVQAQAGGLVAAYAFDEGSGATAADVSW